MSVAIVIPCFRQAQFLAAAIESALDQTAAAAEIIVVDDGSDDDSSEVARRYREVELIRQDNRGLAAARNAGLRQARADKIIFLDADDRLLPSAVRAGLECFAQEPAAAFVYGAFREVRGRSEHQRFVRAESHTDLIRCNWIACVDAVMFDRAKLLAIGGFDQSLGMCEDWDAFLRLSRTHPFGSHQEAVAVYFKHDQNMSNDETMLLHWIDVVRSKELERGLDAEQLEAWREGEAIWRSFYDRNPQPRTARIRGAISRLLGRR
ncbi:MAG: glycosyltransferase [Sphingomonas sp.]|nr:glycosyltransferase [Sphingomonas sp.]